jgi:hypothetical protein
MVPPSSIAELTSANRIAVSLTNAYAERPIGWVRRAYLDSGHLPGEGPLCRLLCVFYNKIGTHWPPANGALLFRPIQGVGRITSKA